ncbi:MAG: HAD-IB family phosphatase [Candidatus Saccharimonadales bacterium]
MKRKFAVFDIDGTVLRWQFFHAIVHELGKQGVLSPEAAKSIKNARMTWKRRTHKDSFHEYEQTLIQSYASIVGGISQDRYLGAINSVFETHKDQVYTYTRDTIHKLKEQNYLLFAVSGSHQEIVKKFGEYYGFDAAVGAEFTYNPDGTIGKFITSPAHNGKGPYLEKLVADFGATYHGSYAFGDSRSDIALLEKVENPVVFNPDKSLAAAAQEHGWKMVIERKNMIYELEYKDGQYILV